MGQPDADIDFRGHNLPFGGSQPERAALAYAGWVLEHIDPRQRLSYVVIVARIAGADHSA